MATIARITKTIEFSGRPGKTAKQLEEAIDFLLSRRGQYIVSQALHRAIEVMEKGKRPEHSNIDDMKYLRENLYPQYLTVEEAIKR